MRFACALLALAACDFQAPPKKAPVAPPVVAITPPASPTPPPVDGSSPQLGSGSAPTAGSGSAPTPATTPECMTAGVHIANVMIDTADLSMQASLEAERTKIVKTASVTCTKNRWAPEILKCIAAATTTATLDTCTKTLKAPDREEDLKPND